MSLPTLYSFRRCPYAIRARMALIVSGVSVEIREVKLSNKPLELALASAKATVPVLVLPDGRVLDESLNIMRWALDRNDPECWFAADGAASDEIIAANDGRFKHYLDRYKYPIKYDADSTEARANAIAMLAPLEARLCRHHNLLRNETSLADIALFPFIRQFAAVDVDWFEAQQLPHLLRWLHAHANSQLFQRTMIKYPIWQWGNAHTVL